jgi:hypothetical protein
VTSSAAVIGALRAAADSLAIDTAIWAARDPANLSREALKAREDALRTIDAATGQLRELRRELAPGVHRVRGRHS